MGASQNKIRLWDKLRSIPELTDTQRYLLMLIAAGESDYSPTAHNKTASEVEASQRALNNNEALRVQLQNCGGNWAIGSIGAFQRLAPYFGADMIGIFGNCIHVQPQLGFDLDYAIVSAIRTARRLQNYTSYERAPNVGTIRLGWASPGLMAQRDTQTERLDRYKETAAEQGFPDGIVDAPLTRMPGNYAQIFQRLRGNG